MAKTRVEAREMRSLERRSMYEIFAPLDPDERLPRELIEEGPPPRGVAMLPRRPRKLQRWELAVAMFVPALLVALTVGIWAKFDPLQMVGAIALLIFGLVTLARSGKRRE